MARSLITRCFSACDPATRGRFSAYVFKAQLAGGGVAAEQAVLGIGVGVGEDHVGAEAAADENVVALKALLMQYVAAGVCVLNDYCHCICSLKRAKIASRLLG